ncbi:hypothetical protein HNQ80_002676 [Anaerosolibacter carboniphilus]|uniref:Uncharacterized protein n=1 Tax=Anaerosolibacter carboniphilus TaxID=1417629 RepID=A0A841L081_9FIRM|nr:hypothetical protein [Anaerosolibacter carboniphilus]MBB6216572.1 hypothetical protein [Anaerosolibacter carboniphilus]
MKRWISWIIIYITCISVLLSLGFSFNIKNKLANGCSPINVFKNIEYISWEEKKMRENPDYDNLSIFIDINAKTLELINLDDNSVLKRYLIANGKE